MAARLFFFGEIFVPGLSVPYLTICQLSHFPSQRRPFHKIDFFLFASEDILDLCKVLHRPRPQEPWTNEFDIFTFRENMAACVTALKRSHDLENYGFDGLR